MRRLARAQEVTADDVVHGLCGQPLGQALRLGMAGGVEWHVHLPLEPQFAVPVGFSVAQQDEFGHACIIDRLIPRQWPHGSSRAGTNTPPHR